MYDVNYSVQFFIDKFESIPEELWCKGAFNKGSAHCTLGHCGFKGERVGQVLDMGMALSHCIGYTLTEIVLINDGKHWQYQQKTPKARILAALYDKIDKELSEANVKEASKLINEVLEPLNV